MKRYGRLITLLSLAVCLVLFSSTKAPAPLVDPDPLATWLGDANGDQVLQADDLPYHTTYAQGSAATYDTPQPLNDDQYWNTGDINGDQQLQADDIPYLTSSAGGAVSDKTWPNGWFITRATLPTDATVSTQIDFQLGVAADDGVFGVLGRPGMNVELSIDPTSPIKDPDVQLGGFDCSTTWPCKVSTGITDWTGGYGGTPFEALTQDASTLYPFSFNSSVTGALVLRATIYEQTSWNIPTTVQTFLVCIDSPGCTIPGGGTPPTITSTAPTTATEDTLYSYPVTATDADSDPITLQLSAGDTCGGTLLDNGDGTGTYSFTPAGPVPPASCTVGVQACDIPDGCGAAQDTLVTITAVNDAPTISTVAPTAATEDTLLSYDANLNDPDGVSQTWSKLGTDTCAGSAIVAGTGVYTYTPAGPVPPVSCLLAIQVCDNGTPNLCATQSSTINITAVNDAPVISTVAPTAATEDTLLSYDADLTDPDGVSQTWSKLGTDTCTGSAIVAGTGVYTYTPAGPVPPINCLMAIQVCDGGTPNLCATQTSTINITAVNDAPTVSTTAPSPAVEDTPYSYDANLSDPDGTGQTWSVLAGDTCGGSIVPATGVYTFTPAGPVPPAGCTINIQVCDAGPLCGSESTAILITAVNDAPVINSVAPTAATEDTLLTYNATYTDPDGSAPYTWSKQGTDTCAGSAIGGGTGVYTFTPAGPVPPASCVMAIQVCDAGALCGLQSSTINITAVNDAPTVTLTCPASVSEPAPINCTIGYSDPEGTARGTCALSGLDTCGGTLTGCTNYDLANSTGKNPSCVVGVTVFDTGTPAPNLSGSDSKTVLVTITNTPPDFSNLPVSNNATASHAYSFAAIKTDANPDTLTCQIAGLAGGPGSKTSTSDTFGAANTSIDTRNDAWADDDAGLPLNLATPANDNQYEVGQATRLELTGWDVTGIPVGSTIDTVVLNVQWGGAAGLGSTYNNFIQYNGTNTTIQPNYISGAWSANTTYNLWAQGIDTIAEIQSLIIGYSNNDGTGGRDNLSFDYIYLAVTYTAPSSQRNTCSAWLTGFSDTPGLSGTTCTVSGTPASIDIGACSVALQVSDGVNPAVIEVLSVTVGADQAPTVTSTAPTPAVEDTLYTYNLTGSDPEGDAITFQLSAGNTCVGASVVGTAYTFTPAGPVPPASCTVGVQACDLHAGCGTAQNTIVPITAVNDAPTISTVAPTAATEDTLLSYDANLNDPDGVSQTWSIVAATDTCDTLAGATIVAGTGVYTMTAAGPVPPASCVLAIQVCDNGTPNLCSATQQSTITITPVNDAPVITTTAGTAATEDALYTYDAAMTDADGTGETWTIAAGDTCGGSIVAGTGVYTFTPAGPVPPATCALSIQVCDAGPACDTELATITITPVNDAPTIALTCPASVTDPAAINCTIVAADPDLTGLTCTVAAATTCGSPVVTGCTSVTASSIGESPSCVVAITVTDSGNPLPALNATDSKTILVSPPAVNNPPTITSTPPSPATEDTLYTYSATATDADGPAPMTWSKLGTDTCTGSAIVPATGVYTFTPVGPVPPASCTIAIQVCDAYVPAGCTPQTVVLPINPVNDAPSINSTAPTAATEDTLLTYNATYTDPDGSAPYTWSKLGTDTCTGSAIGGGTGVYTYTPAGPVPPASCLMAIQVCDAGALCGTQSSTITITPGNDNPVIGTTPALTATEDTLYTYNANLQLPDDGPSSIWSIVAATDTCDTLAGATIVAGTGVYTMTAVGPVPPASCVLAIQVCDGGAPSLCSAVQTGTIVITAVNDNPTITSTAPTAATENTLLSYTATATDADGPAPLTWSKLGTDTCTGSAIVPATGVYTFTPADNTPASCLLAIQVCDAFVPAGCTPQTSTITITQINDAPTISTTAPATATPGVAYNYNANWVDLDGGTASTWSIVTATDTCNSAESANITVNAAIVAGTGVYTFTPAAASNGCCTLGIQVCDNGTPLPSACSAVQSQPITWGAGCSGVGWTSTHTVTTAPGFRTSRDTTPVTIARIANNYPADWNRIDLKFTGGTLTACTIPATAITCTGSGNPPFTQALVGTDTCRITITAGYWPVDTSCTIALTAGSTTPQCTLAGCAVSDVIKTSHRCPNGPAGASSECSPLGGTCGGFIDTGTYGTDATPSVDIRVVDKGSFLSGTVANLLPTNGGYVYGLFEQDYEAPNTTAVQRTEQFDNPSDGLFAFTPTRDKQAKITIGYKGSGGAPETLVGGSCKMFPIGGYDNTRDCYQYSTYMDIDSRCATLPVELTPSDLYSSYRKFVTGDATIASWTSYVGGYPGIGFPNPMRFGLVAPVYKNASLLDLNMDTIFQPSTENQTIVVCFGNGGNTRIAIGAALPWNVMLPDIIRQSWSSPCSAGYTSPPKTTWRFYTFDRNSTLTFMIVTGFANSALFNLDKGLDITKFPIFIKAFGSYNHVVGAIATPNATASMGNTPTNMDMRDPHLLVAPFNHVVEQGSNIAGTSGRTAIATVNTFVIDYERVKHSGSSPAYNNPNLWEHANLGWGGQMMRYAGALFSLGGRVAGATASDPGGIVAHQIHMTQKQDIANFTVFQVGHMNGSGTAPFVTYQNDQPFGTGGATGVTSERQTGFAPTVTDPGGEINWATLEEALSVSITRQSVENWNVGITSTPTQMPGSSLNNIVIGDITDNAVVNMNGFLEIGEVTNPVHNDYYIPAAVNNSKGKPINRNGELWRGTARATDIIGTGVLGKRFTLRNPTVNYDATRYPDYFIMYISDKVQGNQATDIDPRKGVDDAIELNRLWKFYGKIGGKSGSASYNFTVPYIMVGSRTLGTTTAFVPRPWQGNGSIINTATGVVKLEWELADVVIGTKPTDGGVTPLFDYQNHDMNWFNLGFKYGSKEVHEFYWRQ